MNTINLFFLALFPLNNSFNNFSVFFNVENIGENQVFSIFQRMYWNMSSFVFCALIDVEDFNPGTMVKSSPFGNFCPYIISHTGLKMAIKGGNFINFPTHVFIFARSHFHFRKKVSSAIQSGFYKPRIPTLIILTKTVLNLDFLPDFMIELWKLKLSRFNVILFQKNLQVFNYNPFLKLIKNITNIKDISAINRDFYNLHLYKLRLAMYESPPDCYKKDGEWFGRERYYWSRLLTDLNASAEVLETPAYRLDEAKRAVSNGTVDVCPIRYFRTNCPEDLEFSAPYFIERLVVLVPISKRMFHASIGFTSTVWICIIGVFIAVSTLIQAIEKISPTAEGKVEFKYFLDVMGISIGRPIVNRMYERYNWIQKFILMLWQMENLVLIAAFQCALISTLLLAKFGDQISTINNLVDSNLTLYVKPEYVQMISHFSPRLKKQIVKIPAKQLQTLLSEHYLNNQAFALPDSETHPVLTILNENNTKLRYRVMEESLLPGFFTYFFTKNSPFVRVIDIMVLQKYQYGLNRRSNIQFQPIIRNSRNSYTALSFKNFENVFRMVFVCLCLAVGVFIVEMFVSRK